MKTKRLAIVLTAVLLAGLALPGIGLAMSSAGYKVISARFAGGGGQSASSSYRVDGGIGQRLTTFVIGALQIDRALFASGGGPAISSSYRVNGIIGRPFSGGATSASYLLAGATWPISAPGALVLPPEYTLTMAKNGNGSTDPAVGDHTYDAGTVVAITATPDGGWQFVSWAGEVADTDAASTTVTMDGDKTVTASFSQVLPSQYTLTMGKSGSGAVSPGVGPHTYSSGTVVSITAEAPMGWYFASWTGDVANTDAAATTVTMDAGKTVTANFVPVDTLYTLTMAKSGSGSTDPVVGGHTYVVGTVVNIAATPAAGWQFVNWTGAVANGNAAATTVVVNGNKTVTANFTQVPVPNTLTMAANGSGSTSPAVGAHTYNSGTVVDITATPAAGWQFVSWTGDVGNAGAAATTTTVNGNKTVTANFVQLQYVLTMGTNGNGSVDPAVGPHTYNSGTVVNLTATPAAGYRFVNWTGQVANPAAAGTTATMSGNKAVTANFALIQYSLTMGVSGSGSTSPAAGVQSYLPGTVVNVSATPAAGWQFVGWLGPVANAGAAATTVAMDENKVVRANFAKPPEAGFSAEPPTGQSPLAVHFVDQTVGNATAWLWDFGDGQTSTLQNPVNYYSQVGNFTVTLTVTNSLGTDAETKVEYIRVVPVAVPTLSEWGLIVLAVSFAGLLVWRLRRKRAAV